VEQDLELLIIRSRSTGVFVLPNAADYVGVFVRRGTPVARVIDLSIITARVVVEQADVDLVRHRTERVDVRLSERPGATLPALVKREVPGVSEQLPSSALGSAGGGAIASDPTEARGTRALASVFQFDLELPASAGVINVGGRVHVRLCHGSEPLVHRWYRGVRQLFLSRFAV
jgi:putative peptide zinc metalloprotease protein